MHYELSLGVPAPPSGFPLYLFPLTLQKDAAPIPNALAAAEKNSSLGLGTEHVRRKFSKFTLDMELLMVLL